MTNPVFRITGRDETAAAWASAQRTASGGIDGITKLIPGLATALSAAGMVAFAKQTIDAADALADMSGRTGLSAESLSKWRHVLDLSGTSLENSEAGFRKLAANMEMAARGGQEQIDLFKRLGVPVTDASGRLRNLDDVMLDIADRFQAMPDGAQKSALAMRAFGKSGTELVETLSRGSEGIREMMRDAEAMGKVLSTEAAQAASSFNDSMYLIESTAKTMGYAILEKAAPAIDYIATRMAAATKEGGAMAGVMAGLSAGAKVFMADTANAGARVIELQDKIARMKKTRDDLARPGIVNKMNDLIWGDVGTLDKQIAHAEAELAVLKELQTAKAEAAIKANTPKPRPAGGPATGDLDGDTEADKQRAKAREQIAAETYRHWQASMKAHLKEVEDIQKKEYDLAVDMGSQMRGLHEAEVEAKLQAEIQAGDQMRGMFERDQEEKAARLTAETIARQQSYVDLFDSLTSQKGLIEQHYADQMLTLKTWVMEKDAELVAMREKEALDDFEFGQRRAAINAQYYAQAKAIDQRYQADKTRLEDDAIKKRFAIANVYRKADVNSAAFFAGQMADLMQTNSRKLFELGKAGAIAGAVIDTYKAATGAYAALASIPFVGPFLGAAAAAAAIAVGMARVSAIRSQQFGSGGGAGGGAVGTFSASPNTGLPEPSGPGFREAPQSPIVQAPAVIKREVNLHLVSDSGMVSVEWIRDKLIPGLNDAYGDGVKMNFTTSR